MKRRLLVLLLAAVLLSATIMTVCYSDILQLRWAINHYQTVLGGELPEDLTLTIYYLPYYILTRAPLTVEDLMEMEATVKIVVKSDELENHLSALKQLGSSAVQPTKEKFGLNARVYYIFETSDSEKLLEVAMQQFIGDTEAVGAFVNGIAVAKNPVLYEIIVPFLSEEDRNSSGINELSIGSQRRMAFRIE